jgi:hypothetical protein
MNVTNNCYGICYIMIVLIYTSNQNCFNINLHMLQN